MRRWLVFMVLFVIGTVPSAFAGDLVSVKSSFGAKETADRVERLAKQMGMTLFNRIDHAAGAKSIGEDLRPTEVLIFGNPKGGTPLMKCRQSVGIDLPLKMLVWQDETGTVHVGYTDPESWKARHGIRGCDEVLKKMSGALDKLASDSARPGS